MLPVVVFCTASLLQCGVGVGSAFRRSHWEADLLRKSASPENYYEISIFTLTLAGERNITQSSTFLPPCKAPCRIVKVLDAPVSHERGMGKWRLEGICAAKGSVKLLSGHWPGDHFEPPAGPNRDTAALGFMTMGRDEPESEHSGQDSHTERRRSSSSSAGDSCDH